jgi:hypothetical protein
MSKARAGQISEDYVRKLEDENLKLKAATNEEEDRLRRMSTKVCFSTNHALLPTTPDESSSLPPPLTACWCLLFFQMQKQEAEVKDLQKKVAGQTGGKALPPKYVGHPGAEQANQIPSPSTNNGHKHKHTRTHTRACALLVHRSRPLPRRRQNRASFLRQGAIVHLGDVLLLTVFLDNHSMAARAQKLRGWR